MNSRRAAGVLVPATLLALFLLSALAGTAFADAVSPESGGSPNADDIDALYWFVFAIAAVIFVGVEGALLYSLSSSGPARGPSPPRSAATRAWRSGGRWAPRSSSSC